MDLDSVADELYGLAPEEFTAARNAREKEARQAGDRELAAEIRRLAKPTTVAWLANQLVRERRDEIEPLLELGDALREATAVLHGEELRRLSQQQHQLVHALVQQARAIASARGQRVSEDTARGLEDTLRAALADPELGDRLVAARLTDALRHAGFTAGGSAAPPADRPRPRLRSVPGGRSDGDERSSAERRRAEQLERAERDVTEAETAADAAAAERDEEQARLDAAEEARQELADELHRLQEELARVTGEHADAEREERRRRAARDRADRAARDAARRLADAVERRDRLARDDGPGR